MSLFFCPCSELCYRAPADLLTCDGTQVGVLVGVISTSLQAVGLTLQRKSHMLEDEKFPYDTRRPAFKRRRWQVRGHGHPIRTDGLTD